MDSAHLLAAYDDQLRVEGEAANAMSVRRLGPLHLLAFRDGTGLITYHDLDGVDSFRRLVSEALAYYASLAGVSQVEWKTRGHDTTLGLHDALLAHGFGQGETESIMLGSAHLLADTASVPEGVTLRSVTSQADIQAMLAMHAEVFQRSSAPDDADVFVERLSRRDGLEIWIAEEHGRVVSSGRLEPVAHSDFAGLWGGVTRPECRHRGIYRALTAARARSALRMGKTYLHSDSTEYSRPILERSGFVAVSTTTPYLWQR